MQAGFRVQYTCKNRSETKAEETNSIETNSIKNNSTENNIENELEKLLNHYIY